MSRHGAGPVGSAHVKISCVECFAPIVVNLDADERPVCTDATQCAQNVQNVTEAVENRQARILASV